MKALFFSVRKDEKELLEEYSQKFSTLELLDVHLSPKTLGLVGKFDAVSIFVNDIADRFVMEKFAGQGVKLIALRCAGFNNVDLEAAKELGIAVVRVPAYSPHGVAEHTAALLLALNRKIHKAYNRVREGDFSLAGLMGFNLHGKTVGVIGTGKIGAIFAKIMLGFGCKVLAYDKYPDSELIEAGVEYKDLETIRQESRIISLHCPLLPETHHIIDKEFLEKVRTGCILINTSRGALVDTKAVIDSLKTGALGGLAIDVYEEEGDIFFEDLSDKIIQDDVLMRLTTFPNVLITGHQAFYTTEAVKNIIDVTMENILKFDEDGTTVNSVN